MKLENEFVVNAPIERAWEVLTDIPEIAPCLPGARLTGQEGNVYTGKVKIKVGPVTAEYAGTADFLTLDKENYHVDIDAKGRDSRGSGNASAVITADMVPVDTGTQVTITTDLKISGKVAQFGRGVIGDVSKKLIDQFVECIEAKLDHEATSPEDAIEQVTSASAAIQASEASSDASATEVTEHVDDAAGGNADSATDAVTAADAVTATGDAAPANPVSGAGDAIAGASAAVAAAGAGAVAAAAPIKRTFDQPDEELEALDLVDAAGGAVFKRIIPLVVLVAVVLLIIWLATR